MLIVFNISRLISYEFFIAEEVLVNILKVSNTPHVTFKTELSKFLLKHCELFSVSLELFLTIYNPHHRKL